MKRCMNCGAEPVWALCRACGRWYEAIREPANGNFSHNISAHGIASLYPPVKWLEDAAPQEGES